MRESPSMSPTPTGSPPRMVSLGAIFVAIVALQALVFAVWVLVFSKAAASA